MHLNKYQEKALETAVYPEQYKVIYPALGLNGEAGEVAEKVKKVLRGDSQLTDTRRDDIALELGDVLWYVATCAHDLGYSLDDIAKMNIKKLSMRQKKGLLGGNGDHRGEKDVQKGADGAV